MHDVEKEVRAVFERYERALAELSRDSEWVVRYGGVPVVSSGKHAKKAGRGAAG